MPSSPIYCSSVIQDKNHDKNISKITSCSAVTPPEYILYLYFPLKNLNKNWRILY